MKDENVKNDAEYDYTEITVKNKYETLYTENYPKFGWEKESAKDAELEMNAVTLTFRRSRKIPEKTVLTRLVRQFETAAKKIVKLEKNAFVVAAAAGYIIGFAGAALITGAVFSFLAGILTLTIILAVFGLIAVSMAYISFLLLKKRKAKFNEPKIKEQYDEIKELTGQAEKLL